MTTETKDRVKIEPLNGSNYEMWKFRVKMALMKEDLWDMVEDDVRLLGATDRVRKQIQRAMGTIVESVDDVHAMMINSCESAYAMWTKFESHFEQRSTSSKLYIRRKLFKLKMDEGKSMTQHISKIKSLADQLAARGSPVSDDDLVTVLLESLPDTYDNLVTALESRSDDLTWDFLQSRLLHEEEKKKESQIQKKHHEKEDAEALAATISNRRRQEDKNMFENCSSYTYVANGVHRGQNAYRGRYQRGGRGVRQFNTQARFQRKIDCYTCGQQGHYARDCTQIHRGRSRGGVERQGHARSNIARCPTPTSQCPTPTSHFNEWFQGQQFSENGSTNLQAFRVSECAPTSPRKSEPEKRWYLDSGATHHMTFNADGYVNYKPFEVPRQVEVADKRYVNALGTGIVAARIGSESACWDVELHDVYYVPLLGKNLFSANSATSKGKTIVLRQNQCEIFHNRQLVGIGVKDSSGMYLLKCMTLVNMRNSQSDDVKACTAVNKTDITLWHERFGHLNEKSVKELVNQGLVHGIPNLSGTHSFCEPCVQGKMHRLPFPKRSGRRAKDLLDLIHTDLCGPMKTQSLGGAKYFLTFIDDKSRFCSVYFLREKSEVLTKFKAFEALVRNQFQRSIKVLRSDNGSEYESNELKQFCQNRGIQRQLTIKYTPEQNGVSKRMNRTLVESARTMLKAAGMTDTFWAEAISTAAYLRNRSTTSSVKGKTPFEMWSGWKPSVRHLRTFGCNAYAHIPKEKRTKLDSKAEKCQMLGYSQMSKGYRLWSLNERKVIEARDVVFYEKPEGAIEENPSETKCTEEEEKFPRRSGRLAAKERPSYACLAETEGNPRTVSEALSLSDGKKWKDAAQSEYNSLMENETWKLVELPKGREPIDCRWVFTKKRKADGTVERYKARLVAKGFSQKYGMDYEETFSPVVNYKSLRTVLAIAAQDQMFVHQMDVTTAFLNGDLDEEIYMVQPEGFVKKGEENLVCKLERSLYGLKQAPRCWNIKMDTFLLEAGYKKNDADPCIYRKTGGETQVIIALYVDDLLIATADMKQMKEVKLELMSRFKMKDLGKLCYYLGLQICQSEDRSIVNVSQKKYIQDMLKKFGMEKCKASNVPMDPNVKLRKKENEDPSKVVNKTVYQSAVGSLLYAALATRPDISVAVGVVCRFNSNPDQDHWLAVKKIFRYLKGTLDFGIKFQKELKSSELLAFSDADWGGDLDDRKSTTGFVLKLAKGPISWCSRKQCTVALSTAEAEYMALSATSQEVVWVRNLLADLNKGSQLPTVVYKDNQGCIFLAKNPVVHARTKHIDIRHHFIREKLSEKCIKLEYCPTSEMTADILTKPLAKIKFEKLREFLGVCELTT